MILSCIMAVMWYGEPSYSISTQFRFRNDDSYSCDHLYDNEYADRGTTSPRKDPLKEIAWWRETCKTLPQQYQAYSVMMKSSSEVPFEFFVNAFFGYKPKNEDVELVKKGLCPSCKRPWRENRFMPFLQETLERKSYMFGGAK